MLRRRLTTAAATKGNATPTRDEMRPLGAVYRFSRAHLPAHMPSDDVSRLTARPLIVFPSNHVHSSDTQAHTHQRVSSKALADDLVYHDVRERESARHAEKKKKKKKKKKSKFEIYSLFFFFF
jgi:hypothetical protein